MKKHRDSYHHGNLAESLLDAVEDLATRFGLEAVSLRACAKQLGVSPSSAFRHYPDKRALLTAFATRALQQLSAALAEAATNHTTFRPIALAYVRYAIEKPALFRAMWREDTIYAQDEQYRAATATLTRQLTAGFGDALRDCDPDHLSDQELLVWSTLHGLAVLFVDGPLNQVADDATRLTSAEHVIDRLIPTLDLNSTPPAPTA
ncbi:MAG: TetR/AcrR family transcriptional regulator [Pseudomonadota bacterium]